MKSLVLPAWVLAGLLVAFFVLKPYQQPRKAEPAPPNIIVPPPVVVPPVPPEEKIIPPSTPLQDPREDSKRNFRLFRKTADVQESQTETTKLSVPYIVEGV